MPILKPDFPKGPLYSRTTTMDMGSKEDGANIVEALIACYEAYKYMEERDKRENKRRREWVRPLLRRKSKNVFNNLLKEMCLEDSHAFQEFHRMSRENFTELLRLVSPRIKRQDTKLRESISPAQRLSLTLRYLATGESRRSLEFQYRISHSLISSIIPEVCDALYATLKETYLKLPTSSSEWQEVASTFSTAWNFPNCLGALDGKRFLAIKSSNSGSEYYDYKSHHSVIMLALVDAEYKFLYVDVGAQGRASDATMWEKCNLRKYLEEKKLEVPGDASLPNSDLQSPYVFVGDDWFPLKTYLMKPYPGKNLTADRRIFNYRLSRARRVSENAFGILAAKFRVFQQPINSKPEFVNKIIFAAVVLHNFLRANCKAPLPSEIMGREDTENGIIIPARLQEVGGFERLQAVGRGHANEAKTVRNNFKNYFMTNGKVAWQERMALLH